MTKRVETTAVKAAQKQEVPNTMKVKLKCNYKEVKQAKKEGELPEVIEHKPDSIITLDGERAQELIDKAFAVKA